MLVAPLVRNDVHSLLTTRKPVAYERKEYAILFVIAREKCADVPHRYQLSASERHRLYRPHQTQSPFLRVVRQKNRRQRQRTKDFTAPRFSPLMAREQRTKM